ncbi:DUF6538 domain-containing protein, partial [Serratia marcescens]|uniref:DUF6538 domain-containing protein n=1 Tax=Serratia marcescens TaxID=615 RepID=UPI0034D5D45B
VTSSPPQASCCCTSSLGPDASSGARTASNSFRAWVPEKLREAVPGGRSGQKWIALGTADRAEAVRQRHSLGEQRRGLPR